MDKDVVIKVEGLHKKFCRSLKRSMFYGSLDVARDMVGISHDRGKLRPGEFWALDDVNFDLRKGEALGIIGQNGSGKTTLLRLINGIFPPDTGKISVRGRMGALIAVGAGFHPHMSGRENIYLNGTILGMNRNEINKKFDEIVEFADIGEFIDAPVSTFSSGMTVRLGFSIAVHSNPQILLADEILAVGDLSFALKCYKKVAEYKESGGSIILVSHSMQLIRNSCNRVLWIDKGSMKSYGSVQNICDAYENFMFDRTTSFSESSGVHINNDPDINISCVEFYNKDGIKCKEYMSGDYIKIRIYFDCKRKVEHPIFTIGILTAENIIAVNSYSNMSCMKDIACIKGNGHVDIVIPELAIKSGYYNCTVTLSEADISNVLDWHEKNFNFKVLQHESNGYGLLQLPIHWEIRQMD